MYKYIIMAVVLEQAKRKPRLDVRIITGPKDAAGGKVQQTERLQTREGKILTLGVPVSVEATVRVPEINTQPKTETTVEALLNEPAAKFDTSKNASRTPNTYTMPSGDE